MNACVDRKKSEECPRPMACTFQLLCPLTCGRSKSHLPVGRGVLSVAGAVQGIKLRIATSHLESPCGHNQMFSKERVAQCEEVCPCLPYIAGDGYLIVEITLSGKIKKASVQHMTMM